MIFLIKFLTCSATFTFVYRLLFSPRDNFLIVSVYCVSTSTRASLYCFGGEYHLRVKRPKAVWRAAGALLLAAPVGVVLDVLDNLMINRLYVVIFKWLSNCGVDGHDWLNPFPVSA